MSTIQEQIQLLTGCTAQQYEFMVQLQGTRYLQHYTDNDSTAVLTTARRAQFWAWYRNQFDFIDKLFIGSYKNYAVADASITKWLRAEWEAEHQPERMRTYPSPQILTPKKQLAA